MVQFEVFVLVPPGLSDAAQNIMHSMTFNLFVHVGQNDKVGDASQRRLEVNGYLLPGFGGPGPQDD